MTETVLASGIAVMTVAVLFALLPGSLGSLRDSVILSTDSRIVQSVTASYQMLEWAQVQKLRHTGGAPLFYFDIQGDELHAKSAPEASFVASVEVTSPPQLPGAQAPSTRLGMLIIRIAKGTSPACLDDPRMHRVHRVLLAQTDASP
jgi:uncharacterized protein (TIGR02598 family)